MMATKMTYATLSTLQQTIAMAYLNALMDETTAFNIAKVEVYFKGDDPAITEPANISLTPCDYEDSERDQAIMFYVEGLNELLHLTDPDTNEDFVIVGFNGFGYIPAEKPKDAWLKENFPPVNIN